ncbi:hypothetical protein ZWY2020_046653 [Hordeum vulgare]|nr:hypothetical protein ZWY2020_046653 [Hordeum vulgare]
MIHRSNAATSSSQAEGAIFLVVKAYRGLEALNRLVNSIGSEMVELHPPSDSWFINATAFIKDPCTVPKVFDVELSLPADYDDPRYPPPPCSPNGIRLYVDHHPSR